MSDPTVQSLLDELVSQVEQGNVGAARKVLRSIVDRFDQLRENEQLEVRRSSSARRSPDSTDEAVQNLTEHILAASETQVSRGAFLLEAVTILSELEDEQNQDQDTAQVTRADGATELNALGERLQNQQSDYDDAETNVAGVKDEQEIPAQVSVQTVKAPNSVQAGTTIQISTTITNVGDEVAEGVVVKAMFYRDGTNRGVQTVEIGKLGSGEIHRESWEGIKDTNQVLVTVDSANGGSDTSETTILVTGTDSDPSITDYAGSDNLIRLQGLRKAVADWRAGVITEALLSEVTEAWRARRVVN